MTSIYCKAIAFCGKFFHEFEIIVNLMATSDFAKIENVPLLSM